MRILQVVIKNSSSIDFTLPIFWHIKRTVPTASFTVLFCSLNANHIFPRGRYYEELFRELNITVASLQDLSGGSFIRWIASIEGKLLVYADGIQDAKLYNASQYLKNFRRLFAKVALKIIEVLCSGFSTIFFSKIEDFPFEFDIGFVDNRSNPKFFGDQFLFNYLFERSLKPLIIVPHAPHFIYDHFTHTELNPFGTFRRDLCEVWVPLFPTIENERRARDVTLFYSGYCGFDSDWLNYNFKRNYRGDKADRIDVLYLGRKFLGCGVQKPEGFDFVTMSFDEARADLESLRSALYEVGVQDWCLHYKPHPSASLSMVRQLLDGTDIESYHVVIDSLYSLIGRVDIAVSPYSTSLLLFAVSGIPTIVLKNRMLRSVMDSWKLLEDLYGKLNFLTDFYSLSSAAEEALKDPVDTSIDVSHLRRYFPDKNLALVGARLDSLVSDHGNRERGS